MVPSGSSDVGVDVAEQKRALRSVMRERRAGLSAAERQAAAEAASARLVELLEASGGIAGKSVAGYVAVRGELDPAPALAALAARGATIALPKVFSPTPELRQLFFQVVGPDTVLAPGPFDIPEPAGRSLVTLAPAALDVVIVPGLAFDAEGRRVGTGGGYYDQTFTRTWRGAPPTLVGFAYEFQIVDRCPADERDVAVEMVVTEARVIQRGLGGTEGAS
jgi:5-formyltetrahydrofolate cyclo-ligase